MNGIFCYLSPHRRAQEALSWPRPRGICKKKVAFGPLSAAFSSPRETNAGFLSQSAKRAECELLKGDMRLTFSNSLLLYPSFLWTGELP